MQKLPWSFRLRQAWELIVHGTDTRYDQALTIIQEQGDECARLEERVKSYHGIRALEDSWAEIDAIRAELDRYHAALEEIIANEEAYKRGDALSAYIAKTALGIPV